MRRNVAIFALALVVLVIVYFFLVWSPQSTRIEEATVAADTEEARVQQLRAELARLKELETRAPQLREQAAKFETAIPNDPRLAEFILQVQDAASASGIDWVSVNPTPPAVAALPTISEIDLQMNVTGGYFQVQDFLVRLETLPRAVKIGTVNLGAGPAGLPNLTATLGMRMFVAGPPTGDSAQPAGQPAG